MRQKAKTWAALLARLLEDRELTAYRLALQAGLSDGQLSLILSGKRKPTADTLARILRGAGLPWAWLDDHLELAS